LSAGALYALNHNKVCRHAFDREGNTFVQYYGGMELDASLLMIALVGFLPPGDSRIKGTAEAIERDLVADGFVRGIALSRRWTSCLPGKLHSFRVAFG
jgi:GH15 family glucan-1,4-alpha-glucosidase